jgi:hypothetical protein
MTKRVFYKAKFVVEVLSEDPINPNMSLIELEYSITNGDMSGFYGLRESMELNGLACANELMEQGSDPEFFTIDADGNDILEEGDEVEVENGDWVGVIVGFKEDTDGSTLVQVENQEGDVIDCSLSEVFLYR